MSQLLLFSWNKNLNPNFNFINTNEIKIFKNIGLIFYNNDGVINQINSLLDQINNHILNINAVIEEIQYKSPDVFPIDQIEFITPKILMNSELDFTYLSEELSQFKIFRKNKKNEESNKLLSSIKVSK